MIELLGDVLNRRTLSAEEELARHRGMLHHLLVERIGHQKGLLRMEMNGLNVASYRGDIGHFDVMLSIFVQRARAISPVEDELTLGHVRNLREILKEIEIKRTV